MSVYRNLDAFSLLPEALSLPMVLNANISDWDIVDVVDRAVVALPILEENSVIAVATLRRNNLQPQN